MSWLEPLFAPGAFVRAAQVSEAPSPEMGFALLLDGHLQSYSAWVARTGWPALGAEPSARASVGTKLLSAFGQQLTGSGDPEQLYRSLVRSRDSELSTLSLLLLSFLLSDTGRTADAVALLTSRGLSRYSPLSRGLIDLQLSMRLAERSAYGDAVEAAQRCTDSVVGAEPIAWREALEAISSYNTSAFRERVENAPVWLREPPQARRSAFEALIRTDVLVSQALGNYLDQTFESSLQDPFSRSISWRSEDPTEARLRGAIVRSELLGDWVELRRLRKYLGRYLIVSRLGAPGSVPAGALELLRRSGDTEGVRKAARAMTRIGALAPLRAAAESVVARDDLGADEANASLRLLEVGADLLRASDARRGAEMLMLDPEHFVAGWEPAPGALGALVAAASRDIQSKTARFVRGLLSYPDPALVQNLSRVVGGIRWEEVSQVERRAWIETIESQFGTGTDAQIPVGQAILRLAQVVPDEVRTFLDRRFVEKPSLDLLALIVDTSERLPRSITRAGWPLVEASLERTRADAHQGSFAIGTLDIANLATAMLLRDRTNTAGWSQLVDYLTDPLVGISSKRTAFDRLARSTTPIPAESRARLRQSLWGIGGVRLDLEGTPEGFAAAKLRLSGRIGGMTREQTLTQLIALSGSPESNSRGEAAISIPFVRPSLSPPVAIAMALMLSRDREPDVRAAAGYALSQLQTPNDADLQANIVQRLRELLESGGTLVPYNCIHGLDASVRAKLPLNSELSSVVSRLAKHSMSHHVREAAGALLGVKQL